MSLTVIVFTSNTIVIHQNFTGKILVCFIQTIKTSPDFIFQVCLFQPITANVMGYVWWRKHASASPPVTHRDCIAVHAVWKNIYLYGSLWEYSGQFSIWQKSPKKGRYYTERDSTLIGLYFQRQNKQYRRVRASITLCLNLKYKNLPFMLWWCVARST